MKKYMLLAPLAAVTLSACVSPEVVQTNNLGDADMSCAQIATEVAQLEEIRTEAKKGTSASGKNIAAGLLFWPALIGNYANAQEAQEAADKRQNVLVDLSNRKGC